MKKLRITAAMAITALLLAGCDNEEQKVVPDPAAESRTTHRKESWKRHRPT